MESIVSLVANLYLDNAAFGLAAGQVEYRLKGLSRTFDFVGQKVTNLGSKMQGLGGSMTLALAPFSAMAAGGVAVASKFEDSMNIIGLKAGATEEELRQIQQRALEYGRDGWVPQEAADGMLELMSSGYDLDQALQALDTVMIASTASGAELGFVADTLTDVMAAFGLEASDSEETMQSMMAAVGKSSATLSSISEGFMNVGPVANNFGLSVHDTAAALANFSEQGIKGAEAGTQLRSMLNNMTRDTDTVQAAWDELGTSFYNADGTMRHLDDVIDDINEGLADKTPAETQRIITDLAGTYGQMGLSALLATGGIDEMSAAMSGATSMTDVANARMETFSGSLAYLKGSVETFFITVFTPLMDEVLAPFNMFLHKIVLFITDWATANESLAKEIVIILGVASLIGGALLTLGTIFTFVGGLITAFSPIIAASFTMAATLAKFVFKEFRTMVAYYGGWQAYVDNIFLPWMKNLIKVFQVSGMGAALKYVNDTLGKTIMDFIKGGGLQRWAEKKINTFARAIENILGISFDSIGDSFKKKSSDAKKSVDAFFSRISDAMSSFFSGTVDVASWVWNKILVPIGNAISAFISGGWIIAIASSLGSAIMDGLTYGVTAIKSLDQWVMDSVLTPLGNAISSVMSSDSISGIGDALADFGSKFLDFIAGGMELIGNIGDWLMETLINPLVEKFQQAAEDGSLIDYLRSLGGMFLDFIKTGITARITIFSWVFENVIKPIAEAVMDYAASGQLVEDLKALGGMFLEVIGEAIEAVKPILKWVWDELISPMANAIGDYIGSGQLVKDLQALGEMFLPVIADAIETAKSITQWLLDEVILPMSNAIGDYIGSGQIWDDLEALGKMFLDAIAWGITAIFSFNQWFNNELVIPLGDSILNYVKSGKIYDDLTALGDMFLNTIAYGIEKVIDIATWVRDEFITPLANSILVYVTSGKLLEDLRDLGQMFLDAVAFGITALFSFQQFILNKVIMPLVDEIAKFIGVGDLWDQLKELGAGFLDAILAGIGNIPTWIDENIIQPLITAISSFDLGETIRGGLPPWLGGTMGERASGGPVMANRAYVVGERGPEVFVPSASGTILPNQSTNAGLNIGTIVINAPSGDGAEIARSFESELAMLMRGSG